MTTDKPTSDEQNLRPPIRVRKKVARDEQVCGRVTPDETRDGAFKTYLEGEWHETLMKIARLSKVLGISRKCKHCGNAL